MREDGNGLLQKFRHYLPFGCFVAAVLSLCFAYGIAVGKWHLFPYNFLSSGWDSLKNPANETPAFVHPARYEGEGLGECSYEQVQPGVTLIAGYLKDGDDWNRGIQLLDLRGNVLHEWRCDPRHIWARPPHQDITEPFLITEETTYVHGTLLLPGGEVIFNLEYFGLVKLNSRSEVIWKLPYRTHHSMFEDDAGSMWVCGLRIHEEAVPQFPDMKPPFWEDTVLKVSLDGVIEREISMLEIIHKSGYHGLLRFDTGDILHLNDVEVLNEQKARAFDLFEVGDIMVSLRAINTVLVIDGDTERIKWSLTYPFGAQHDPDFTEDGRISVFDNHVNRHFQPLGRRGSRIVCIEPSAGEVATLYGHKEGQYFFSARAGKHQQLPNGNLLITETYAGRVFEIDGNGEAVWNWHAPKWNRNFVSEILEGTRYGPEYADFTDAFREVER